MPIMRFKKYVREAITRDAETMETAQGIEPVDGTSHEYVLRYNGDSSNIARCWLACTMVKGTTYTIGTGDAYYGGVIVYNADGAKVAEETFSYDNYTTTAATYTPTYTGLHYIYLQTYAHDGTSGNYTKTLSCSPWPGTYELPTLTPNRTSEGFDAFGYPIRYRSALEAGVGAGGITTNGLLLYHPLETNLLTLPTGQTASNKGTVSYQTYKGVPCAKFDSSCVRFGNLSTLSYPATMSVWYNMTETTNDFMFLAMLVPIGIGLNYKKVAAYNDWDYSSEQQLDTWIHVAVVWDTESKRKLYVNGELVHEYESTTANNSSSDSSENRNQVGGDYDNNPRYFKGYAAGLRVYSRALKDAEIVKLAKEFNPTA